MSITITEEQTRANLANFLKKKIDVDHFDIHEVANQVCIQAQTLVMYMQRTAFPSPEGLQRIAKYFHTETNKIIAGDF